MPQSDAALFDKWRSNRDADAFAELLSRHATMVYGACLRVLRNPGMAEEVAQESFLELMKGPRSVRSIGAWLHTVATRRALDRLKAEGRRQAREQAYAAARNSVVEADWDDARAFVDEAIAALPEELRVPVVLRFLEGRTHDAIADELGLPRSTVRSRIDKGIGVVRENLFKRGVIASAGAITAGLESLPVSAAPTTLVAELGRRAIAMRSRPSLVAISAGVKYALMPMVLAALVLGGGWAAFGRGAAPEESPAVADSGGAVVAALAAPAPTLLPEVPTVESGTLKSAEAEVTVAPETVSMEVEEDKTAEGWVLDLTPSEKIVESMKRPVQISFRDTHIQNILEFMQDTYDVNLVLDGRVVAPVPGDEGMVRESRRYVTDGHIRHIDQQGKSLEETLAVLTGMANLTYKVRGNMVWISSSAQITRDLTLPPPSAPFREAEILDSITSQPAFIKLKDMHVFEMLKAVARPLGISVVIDERVVMPPQKRGEEPPPVLPTYVTDGTIDYICLEGASGAEMLFVLTRLVDLTYRVDKDGVYISTPDRVRESF